ncbi:MAG TPA: hypothetical protein V6C97_30250 [Oculatellaceae cyanobacterium]
MSAIVIEGTPEQVWPWLTQIGQDKAGWYSYRYASFSSSCREFVGAIFGSLFLSLFENMFGANITNLDYLLNLPEPVVGDKMWVRRLIALFLVSCGFIVLRVLCLHQMAPNTSSAAPYSVFGRIKRPEYFVMLMHWGMLYL